MTSTKALIMISAVAIALASSACGSSDEDTGGGAAGASAGGSSGQTVKIGATFIDYLSDQPIEGLEVCTLIPTGRNPGCAKTPASGKLVAPGFPTNSKLLFKLTKTDYFTTLIPAVSGNKDDTSAQIFPVKQQSVTDLLTAVGLSQEAGKGAISFIASKSSGGKITNDGVDKVSVTISSGSKPVYMKSLAFDTSATETDSTGLGVFLNLEPNQDYTLTFTHPSLTCKTRLGWTGAGAGETVAPVKADMITYVLTVCE